MEYRPHAPVMVQEVMEALVVHPSGTYLDATAGGGGHTAAILERLDAEGKVLALDRDADALVRLRDRFGGDSRVRVVQGNFSDIGSLQETRQQAHFAGVLFDFGLSSHQIDEPDRGFSFQQDGPLDMRMDRSMPLTAADIVNGVSEDALARLLREFGDVKGARGLAQRIIQSRPLAMTADLVRAVRGAGRDDFKQLARVFQALRIEVNGELAAIDKALAAVVDLLAPGGRMVTLAYHSLEDRRVKRLIRRESGEAMDRLRIPVELRSDDPVRLRAVFRKSKSATAEEIGINPRARSARMRVAERTQ